MKQLFRITPILLLLLSSQLVLAQTTIKMRKEGGVYSIPCTVNGLKLRFIFDTGASNVTISLTEAIFMLKNDYLSESDIHGSTYSQLANGEISENTRVTLREIEFAGIKLTNVDAVIVHNVAAPLLLGQSAMAKIGKFEFDPTNATVTFYKGKQAYVSDESSTKSSGSGRQSSTGYLTYNGYTYKTVIIGNQEWTAENLRSTKYNDGTPIGKIVDNEEWTQTYNGAYCAYDFNESNAATYGYLYNWYAVETGKLAPAGWRVPTDEDWTKLTDYVGGETTAGTKLKAKSGWHHNGNGTDDYGFSALPGGSRHIEDGHFFSLGNFGNWWSSTASWPLSWGRYLFYGRADVFRYNTSRSYGMSVRLVRDVQ